MRIGITGATGFIGQQIIRSGIASGHAMVAFSRRPDHPVSGCVQTRAFRQGGPIDVGGCDAIIHLAGENVFGLWTAGKRRQIRRSRVEGTRSVVESLGHGDDSPRILISGSAVGFYGDTGETAVDEEDEAGKGFLAEVSQDWEAEARKAESRGVRVVRLRTGMVLGPGGGALAMMAPLFRRGLGADLGSGRQWMAWIHLEDVARLALFAAENEMIAGPLNAVGPEECRNSDFTDALSEVLHRPAPLRVPAWAVRAALGGFAHELLDSKRVIPQKALETGFEFRFPSLCGALQNAVGRAKD